MLLRDDSIPADKIGALPPPRTPCALVSDDRIADDLLAERTATYLRRVGGSHARLAGPIRGAAALAFIKECFPQFTLAARAARESYGEQSVIQSAMGHTLAKRVSRALAMSDVDGMELLNQALLADWFALDGGTSFDLTPALQEQLAHTDVGALPASYLRPPFKAVFFRWQGTPLEILPGVTVACEGAYVFTRQRTESVYDMFIAMAQRNEGFPVPFHMPMTVILVDDDELSDLSQAFLNQNDLQEIERDAHEMLQQPKIEGRRPDVEEVMEPFRVGSNLFGEQLGMLSKALLYVNSSAARGENETPSFTRKKAPPESVRRAYAGGRLPIVVGPTKPAAAAPSSARGRGMPVHWRRGHFRHVRHGEGRQFSKLMYFEPVLVNAEKMAGDQVPPKKPYRVGRSRVPRT